MNLYMEISTLGVTFAACASSIFGMNLSSGIEEDPYAFYLVTLFITIFAGLIILFCIYRFATISNSQKALDYPILKDIFRLNSCFHFLILPFP